MDQVPSSTNNVSQPAAPAATPPTPSFSPAPESDFQRRMLEDLRLSIRDIAMVVAELQFGLDDAIAVAATKTIVPSTPPMVQPAPVTQAPPQPVAPPQVAEPVVVPPVPDNTHEQEEIKSALSDLSLSVPPIPTPVEEKKEEVTSLPPQVDLNVLTETQTPPIPAPQQSVPPVVVEPVVLPNTPVAPTPMPPPVPVATDTTMDYKNILTVLSEAGVALLKTAIEDARKKQELPAGEITERDMVEFLLDEKNNEYLKEFGDLTPIRSVIRERLPK